MNENIDISNFKESIKTKNFKIIFDEFLIFLKEENDQKKKDYLCNELISFDIENTNINKMCNFRNEIDRNYRNKFKEKLYNCKKHSIWREIEDYWFNSYTKILETTQNINNLLLIKEEDKNNPIKWLNKYI